MLHAVELGFEHPATGKRMRWEKALPGDLAALLRQLRPAKR
jgi:23S rRNA pseudouridine1911/1915/1917 synthase